MSRPKNSSLSPHVRFTHFCFYLHAGMVAKKVENGEWLWQTLDGFLIEEGCMTVGEWYRRGLWKGEKYG